MSELFIIYENCFPLLVMTSGKYKMIETKKNGTICTIKFSIPKLYEDTSFHNFNVTHAIRKNHQVTLTFMENQKSH